MTISTTAARTIFNCNGVSTVFPVPIQAYLATDFEVILTAPVSTGGTQTILTLNSNYTLATSGSLSPTQWTLTTQTGGGITSPYPTGYTLQIFLNPTQSQQTSYVQGQQFPSLAVQTNFDRLTQMVQRLEDQVSRAITAPDGDVNPLMSLPNAASRVNQALLTDANGNIVTGVQAAQTFTALSLSTYGTDSGAVNAYVVTHGGPVSISLVVGTLLRFVATNANTGASTLNADGTGAIAVVGQTGLALTGGEILTTGPTWVQYTGSAWQIVGTGALPDRVRTPGEIAAAITPANFTYLPYDSRRFGVILDSGTTDNKIPLQNALNATAGYYPLVIYGNGANYGKVGDGITCPANSSIIGIGYPELRWSAITRIGTTAMGVTTHPAIEALGDNFSCQGVMLSGPSGAGVFTSGETGILRVGTSAANRGNKFYVEDCEIRWFGQFAVLTEYMSNIVYRKNKVHDCGYSGGTHGSGFKILHEFNEIYNITPGASGNAYGDNFTHNSAGYNTDPMVNSPITAITQAASAVVTINIVSGSNPFSVGQMVTFFGVSGMNALNNLTGQVTAIGGSSGAWTVTVAINSSAMNAFVPTGTISGITLANPCVVTINNATAVSPYTVGQLISFAGITGTTQLNGTSAYISAISGSSGAWNLTFGNVNSSGFTAWVSGGTTNSNGFICCPRQAAHPFCISVISRNNLVHDIPLWSGIDFHGAYDSIADNNETYNCYIHVQLSGSSGNAIGYAGENNSITNNRCNYNRQDGSAATINAARGSAVAIGINTVGGNIVTHRNVVVSGNTFNGPMGDPAGFNGSAFVFGLQFTQNLTCVNNTVNGWNGVAMYCSHTDGILANNTLATPSTQTNSYCVYAAGYCGELDITGNKHSPTGGQSAAVGMDVNTLGMSRMLVSNEFNSCTTPYGSNLLTLTRGNSDITPRIIDNVTGSHTVDISPAGWAREVMILAGQSGVATLTNVYNGGTSAPAFDGQRVTIVMTGSSTLTVNNTGAGSGKFVLQGGTIALSSSSTLSTVVRNGNLQELSRTVGNT